jgi:TatD DNase family protein
MAILRQFDGKLGPCVTHCFTGTRAEMYECLDAGHSIGITGWLCDERRGQHLREIVRDIPAGRLLVETDAPYLLPRTVKPPPSHRRNEPMYLAHIVAELARDRGEDVATTAAATSATATAFFRLP